MKWDYDEPKNTEQTTRKRRELPMALKQEYGKTKYMRAEGNENRN